METYPGKELESMSFAVNYHRWIIEEFAPYLGPVVVEVGAGRGDLSACLLSTGVKKLHVFEPATELFSELKIKLSGYENVTLVNGFFARSSSPEGFDSIIYVNVLEHIEKDFDELAVVHSSLASGGHLLVFVPALSWLYSRADREMGHYRRYSLSGLVEIVQSAGFEIVRSNYFDVAGVIPWYLNFVLLKNSFSPKSVALYDRWVVPITKAIERRIPPPVGKNILLVARKP